MLIYVFRNKKFQNYHVHLRILGLKNLKNKYYKKYKKCSSPIYFYNYCVYTILNTTLYKKFINNTKNNIKRDPKLFYKFINSKKTARITIATCSQIFLVLRILIPNTTQQNYIRFQYTNNWIFLH